MSNIHPTDALPIPLEPELEPWEIDNMEDAPDVAHVPLLCAALRFATKGKEEVEVDHNEEVDTLNIENALLKKRIVDLVGELKKLYKAQGREIMARLEWLEATFELKEEDNAALGDEVNEPFEFPDPIKPKPKEEPVELEVKSGEVDAIGHPEETPAPEEPKPKERRGGAGGSYYNIK